MKILWINYSWERLARLWKVFPKRNMAKHHVPIPSSIFFWLTLFLDSIFARSWVTWRSLWFCSLSWVFKAFSSAILVSLEVLIPSMNVLTSVTPVLVSAMFFVKSSTLVFWISKSLITNGGSWTTYYGSQLISYGFFFCPQVDNIFCFSLPADNKILWKQKVYPSETDLCCSSSILRLFSHSTSFCFSISFLQSFKVRF